MPFDLNTIGDYLSSDRAPVQLGQLASAVMGPYQNEWQSQLGNAAATIGQSNIAAKAAGAQAEERASLMRALSKFLSGEGLTPAGSPGPTSATLTAKGDGTSEFKMAGDGSMISPESSPVPGGSTVPKVTSTSPATSVQSDRMLPFFLALLSGSGSAGGGTDLRGLSPEQIASITQQDISGGALANQSVGNIFENLQRMALADYYDRLPQEQKFKPEYPNYINPKIDNNTKTWWFTDSKSGKNIDSGIAATAKEMSGEKKPAFTVTERVRPDGIRERLVLKDGEPFTSLGPYPETSEEESRFRSQVKDVADIEDRILSDKGNPTDIDNFNRYSDSNYIYIPKKEGFLGFGKSYEKIDLPPGTKASDVYYTARKYGVSMQAVINSIVKKSQ